MGKLKCPACVKKISRRYVAGGLLLVRLIGSAELQCNEQLRSGIDCAMSEAMQPGPVAAPNGHDFTKANCWAYVSQTLINGLTGLNPYKYEVIKARNLPNLVALFPPSLKWQVTRNSKYLYSVGLF